MVNPLDANCKLKQKGTEQKGEEMTHSSKRHHVENQPKWVAQKQSKSVAQGFDIKADGFRQGQHIFINESWDCGLTESDEAISNGNAREINSQMDGLQHCRGSTCVIDDCSRPSQARLMVLTKHYGRFKNWPERIDLLDALVEKVSKRHR